MPDQPNTTAPSHGGSSPSPLFGLHRITITHDGIEIMGISTAFPRPENYDQMVNMLTEVVGFMNAPTVKDDREL